MSPEREPAVLLQLIKLDLHPFLLKAILDGNNVTAVYDDLPLEQLLVLDQKCKEMPGLRWLLRKQRGRYLLTVLATTQLEKAHLKGEP